MNLMVAQPLAIRTLARDLALDLVVLDDAPLLGIDHEHASRLQAALLQDVVRRYVEHARFGREHDQAVLRHVVARRAQAVAIQQRADLAAVGEADRSRAVPRLHQARVVLVERPLRVVHGLVVRPGLRNHHHHRVRERAACEDEQLERVVEHRRVGAVRVDDRQDLLHVLAKRFGLEQRLAGVHPVGIAANGVDLAVMRDVAVRMRAVPARERVRAEARMDQRERGLHQRIGQVGKVGRELLRQQHALVHERLVRKARDVPRRRAFERRSADLAVGALADHVELALERELVAPYFTLGGVARDEYHAHERLEGLRRIAQHGVVRRHRAPTEHALTLRLHDLLEAFLDAPPQRRVTRQKHDAAAVGAGLGQLDARLLRRFDEEAMRHLQQDAGAVAGIDLRPACAAVIQVCEHLQGLLQDAVRFAAFDIDDETDAARIVLERRVVQALLRRKAGPAPAPFVGRTHSGLPHRINDFRRSRPVASAQRPHAKMHAARRFPHPEGTVRSGRNIAGTPWLATSKLLIQLGCFAQADCAARGPPRGDDASR
jgi:hypothetical protein